MSEESTARAVPTAATPKTSGNALRRPMRSSFGGINEMFNSFIPVHEKGLKTGFYNSIALIFLIFVLIIIYFCYWILKPFLQPLVWAILCGSALHPFKRKLLLYLENWISDLRRDCRPITVGTVFLPFYVINNTNNALIHFLINNYKIFIFIGFLIGLHNYFTLFLTHLYSISFILIPLKVVIEVIIRFFSVLTDSNNTLTVISITIGYLIGLCFGWSDATHNYLTHLAPIVWFILIIHIISLSGTIVHILSLLLVIIILIGLAKTLFAAKSHSSDQIDGVVSRLMQLRAFLHMIAVYIISWFKNQENVESVEVNEENTEELETRETERQFANAGTSPMPQPSARTLIRRSSMISNAGNLENKYQSNNYLYVVLWAVVLVHFWSKNSLVYFTLIPVFVKLLTFGWFYITSLIFNYIQTFDAFIQKRKKALFHPSIQSAFNYFLIGDKLIMDTIETSLNGLTSLSVICLTIVSILFATIFMSIQIYGESLHLVNLMSNVLNQTMSNYPESSQLLPESFGGIHGMLDEVVRNGYEYGREYIQNSIRNALNVDPNVTKTKVVEKQILEIWDRAYHLWLIRNTNDTEIVPKKGPYDFDKLSNAFKTLDLTLCFNIIKSNIDVLVSVFDSVWLLLKGNFTLLFTVIAAVFSTLLGGGLGLMNLVLSFIIFMTALFYLLSASGESYKPVELVNRIFPSEVTQQRNGWINSDTNSKFGRAVEEAINGVFAASLKMSAFYGLYTWLIHTLFDVNIVYIPSVMAAMFGAIPFLSAFWASFPAFLELFFVKSQATKAVLLLITAYFPSFFVDSTIYSEIKSAGHPYLTGLAIAGGVFYLGIEGALFGPILLCCLFVAFNMYSSIMQESTASPMANPMAPDFTSHSTVKPINSNLKRIQSLNDFKV